MLSAYLTSLRSTNPTTPIIIDENGALSVLSSYLWQEISSFDEIQTGDFPWLFLYGIPEEKQHFDILTVRKCIADMSLEPYEGKNFAILRDFHTATLDAQNAMLKLLEDCPNYTAIILVVADIESLLDTIRSRVISLYMSMEEFRLSSEIRAWMDDFFTGRIDTFVKYLYDAKYTKEEAIAMLRYAISLDTVHPTSIYEQGIESIFSTNENPRNILDSAFL